MTEKLTDEQLRKWRDSIDAECWESSALTELLALRAERAKPPPSDEERAHQFMSYNFGDDELGSAEHAELVRTLTLFSAEARTEGSAERAKLEAVLRRARAWIENHIEHGSLSGDWHPEIRLELKAIDAALAQPAESGATLSWGMHMARLEEANGDPEISGGLHLAKPTEQQCDCCGQIKECENVVVLGMDTTVCEECRDAGANP